MSFSTIILTVAVVILVGVIAITTIINLIKTFNTIEKLKQEEKEFKEYSKKVEETINDVRKKEESIHTGDNRTDFEHSLGILQDYSKK